MKYKIDYYGYIYEWTNIKNGKKYIGSHYGSVDDCYTGSGKAFKPAYNRNPNNFKMNVLEYLVENDKKLLLKKEQQWLNCIPNIRENKNYYNLNNYSLGGSSHITRKHIEKRSNTLKEKHIRLGLSEAEQVSYKIKIETRLARIASTGFTEKEKEQHAKYGFQLQVTTPEGEIKIFDSCGQATRELGIDVQYGLKVCTKKLDFKGYKIVKLKNPLVDCRQRKI
jgi:hypothetical protein